ISFLVPAGLSGDAARYLERACVAGGPDNMPWPTEVRVEPEQLQVRRAVDESGYLLVPWEVGEIGRLMGSTATLMERPDAYCLPVELARGKINQLRGQAADWQAGGLVLTDELEKRIKDIGLAFGRAAVRTPPEKAAAKAQAVLIQAYQTA